MSIINNQQIAELKSRLLQEKQEIEHRLSSNDHYGLASSLRDETSELSPIDNHPGDLATETYERGKDVALLEREDLHLARISAALSAMENGQYGTCRTCGEPIPFDRLAALPDTLFCIKHAPRQDISDERPEEESFLRPPFGRSSMDQQSSYNGFDGEDSWQIVESWGNSNSPAMSENPDADYENLTIEYDENEGFVEPLESFLATDITGNHVVMYRNRQYREYMAHNEGDRTLEAFNEEE